jgi:CheY-like chemotaxis protein
VLRKLRVLVVDDNATNRQVLREMLRAWGWTFAEAADAWEALERLKAAASTGRAFDLALIDFQMPEMDGAQLAAEIKNDPLLAGIPLLLVTSVPQHGDAARMLNLGFAAYLTKPVKQAVLHESIVAVMRARAEPARDGRPRLSLVTAHTVSEASRTRRRILVVDDVASSREVAAELLRQAGYACDVAADGSEALRAFRNAAYDLVFMDCEMPDVDGYEATRRIRTLEMGRERTPIVALTGEILATDRERCLSAGMDDAIGKPVRAEDFRRMLERYLRPVKASVDPEPDEPTPRQPPVPPSDPTSHT